MTQEERNLRQHVRKLKTLRQSLRSLERDVKKSAAQIYRSEGLLMQPPIEKIIQRFG